MKPTLNMRVYQDDRLVKRWRDDEAKAVYSQGKRVSADCPFTADERKLYVFYGTAKCLKRYMARTGKSLAQAIADLKGYLNVDRLTETLR